MPGRLECGKKRTILILLPSNPKRDDEEDGDRIAPSVPNPKCESDVGSGARKRK
jgi:hypothetical protein